MKAKSVFRTMLLITILVLFSLAFVSVPAGIRADVPTEIGVEQAAMLAVAASALVFLGNLYLKSQGKKLPREALTAIVYAVSVVLAYLWSSPSLPTIPIGSNPAALSSAYIAFGQALLTQGALVLGFATLIYNWLLKRIDEKYFSDQISKQIENLGQ
jgi:hypothetical protein